MLYVGSLDVPGCPTSSRLGTFRTWDQRRPCRRAPIDGKLQTPYMLYVGFLDVPGCPTSSRLGIFRTLGQRRPCRRVPGGAPLGRGVRPAARSPCRAWGRAPFRKTPEKTQNTKWLIIHICMYILVCAYMYTCTRLSESPCRAWGRAPFRKTPAEQGNTEKCMLYICIHIQIYTRYRSN